VLSSAASPPFYPGRRGSPHLTRGSKNGKLSLNMKKYFALAVLGLAFVGFSASALAGSCGGCGSDHGDKEKKAEDKTEESTQS
jgi:hypothetical protein